MLKSTLIAKKDCIAKYKDGMMQSITLMVKVVLELQYNLISTLQAFKMGLRSIGIRIVYCLSREN